MNDLVSTISERHQICIVSTVELPIVFFMIPHLKMLQQYFDLTVVVNTDNTDFLKEYGINAKVIPVGIERKISLLRDIKALFRLTIMFRNNKFDMVHSIAPKAGLLAMSAGLIAGVPRRLHCFTGQVWGTTTGLRRYFLKTFDRLIAAFATHLLADSHSQRSFLVQEGIVGSNKIMVLVNGSVCGVDLSRFRPDYIQREMIRREYDIATDAILFLFLGRLTRDKGVIDLAQAFLKLISGGVNANLLIVGPDEEGIQADIEALLSETSSRVHFVGYTKVPEQFMAAADALCLPSYREGFGMVILEAAAAGIPSVATRIYGITDAVIDGATGLLCDPGDINGIWECLRRFTLDQNLREVMGRNARERAIKEFSQAALVAALLQYYMEIN